MLKFFIKHTLIGCLLVNGFLVAQNNTVITPSDSTVYKQRYGLRAGADLSKLVRTFFDNNYTGFEIMADYRLTKRIYLAGELGNEERTIINEVLNNTTKGSYFKAGADMNFYKNWLDMENMIYVGARIGASTFSQTLNSYNVYNTNNQYWNNQFNIEAGQTFKDLTALWTELIFGIKAEFLNNLYFGINVQLKYLVTEKAPNNFENLYIPGFNRTYDSGKFGSGYGLNVAYLIPIYKKNKVVSSNKLEE